MSVSPVYTAHGSATGGRDGQAKVAGTEINGELASHYERVCGNKGNSYDVYQLNQRAKAWLEKAQEKALFNAYASTHRKPIVLLRHASVEQEFCI